MAATDLAESGCGRWQEDQQGRGPDVTPIWTVTDPDPPGLERTPAGAAEEKHTQTLTHTLSFVSISQSRPFPVLLRCPNAVQMFTHF